MTEQEAKNRLCHLSLALDPVSKCVGSLCMAWRTTQGPNPNHYGYDEAGKMVQSTDVIGFCGLAGRP